MNSNWENYEVSYDLSIPGFKGLWQNEYFLVDDKSQRLFAFQDKTEYSDKNEGINNSFFILNQENKDLALFFKVSLGQEKLRQDYIEKLTSLKIISENKFLKLSLFNALGISRQQIEDYLYIFSLPALLKNLYLEKRIPVKIIRILEKTNLHNLELLIALANEISMNNNSIRESLNLWIDLSNDTQLHLLATFKEKVSLLHADQMARAGDILKKLIFELRYPQYTKVTEEIEDLKHKLTGKINLEYDPMLEKNSIILKKDITSEKDYEDLLSALNNNQNRQLILEIVSKIS